MRKRKKDITALVLMIVVLTSMVSPMHALAAQAASSTEVVEAEVVYTEVGASDFSRLFGVKAPVKSGYYFGGWYQTADETEPIKSELHKDEIVKENKNVYAKFVPAYMLNVKVQNSSELTGFTENYVTEAAKKNITKSSLRMVSAIDSTKYREVGFHVFVNGNRVNKRTESVYNKTVYDKIIANGTGKTAESLFGMQGKLMIAKFINIPVEAWGTSIYVRPYWVTFDGIEVRGNGKYIHMEDGILGYMTIPINLQGLTNANAEGVASGVLDAIYNPDQMTFVDVKDEGGVLDSVAWSNDQTNGKIRFAAVEREPSVKNVVPNIDGAVKRKEDDTTNTYENVNNTYATVRFKKGTETPTAGYRLNFESMEFCDVEEEFVEIQIWNSRY